MTAVHFSDKPYLGVSDCGRKSVKLLTHDTSKVTCVTCIKVADADMQRWIKKGQ